MCPPVGSFKLDFTAIHEYGRKPVDANRFDSVTRALQAGSPRRAALSLLLGGALGLTSLADGAAKKGKGKGKGKGKKKKKCGNGKKLCGNRCIAQTDCCTDSDCNRCAREICQDGVCDCHPSLIRSNGVCGTFTGCKSAGLIVQDSFECCSDEAFTDQESGQTRCLPGKFECIVPLDCVSGGPCRGFMCPELYVSHVGSGC
jgi:hypothetical protein